MNPSINNTLKIVGMIMTILLFLFFDIAEAQSGEGYGRERRATRRRTAIVVSSVTHEKDQEAAQQQQAKDTTKSTQTSQTQQQVTTETTPPPTKTTDGTLPLGTVVTSLPEGCKSTSVNNQAYYECGGNYYRTAFQGNNLVYVTTSPPK